MTAGEATLHLPVCQRVRLNLLWLIKKKAASLFLPFHNLIHLPILRINMPKSATAKVFVALKCKSAGKHTVLLFQMNNECLMAQIHAKLVR